MVIDPHCKLIVSTVFLALICSLSVVDCGGKKDEDSNGSRAIKVPMMRTNVGTNLTIGQMITAHRKTNTTIKDESTIEEHIKLTTADDTLKTIPRPSTPLSIPTSDYGS